MTPLDKSDLKALALLRGHKSTPLTAPVPAQLTPKKKIVQRKIVFDVPFVIMVEDNFGNGLIQSNYRGERKFPQSAVEKTKSTTIDFSPAHNSPNQTPLDCPPPYVVDTKYGIVRIYLLKVNSKDLMEFPNASNHEFMGSVSKEIGFTCVMIEFGENTFDFDLTKSDTGHSLTNEAFEAFNKFLLNYKLLANRLYIPSVTVQSIGKFAIIDLMEDKSIQTTIAMRQWEQPIPFSKVIPKDLDKIVRVNCMENKSLDLFSILRHEAWNKIVLKEWRMAVVSSVILFESWITPTLEDIYRMKGLNDGEIKRKFKTDAPRSDDRKPLSLTEICEKVVLDAMDFDFRKTPEYDNLLKKAIQLRNSIIHRSKLDVTSGEAYDCIHSVMNAITMISHVSLAYSHSNVDGFQITVMGSFDNNPR